MRLSLVILVAVVMTAAAHAASDPPTQTFFNSGSRQVSVSTIFTTALLRRRLEPQSFW
jgi:hypothetical protein